MPYHNNYRNEKPAPSGAVKTAIDYFKPDGIELEYKADLDERDHIDHVVLMRTIMSATIGVDAHLVTKFEYLGERRQKLEFIYDAAGKCLAVRHPDGKLKIKHDEKINGNFISRMEGWTSDTSVIDKRVMSFVVDRIRQLTNATVGGVEVAICIDKLVMVDDDPQNAFFQQLEIERMGDNRLTTAGRNKFEHIALWISEMLGLIEPGQSISAGRVASRKADKVLQHFTKYEPSVKARKS